MVVRAISFLLFRAVSDKNDEEEKRGPAKNYLDEVRARIKTGAGAVSRNLPTAWELKGCRWSGVLQRGQIV